jgi:hypothetical protein
MADHDKQFQMRVSDAFLESIDDWRRGQSPIPSRAEAIRYLVSRGIVYEHDLTQKHEHDLTKKEIDAERREARRARAETKGKR